MSTKPSERIVVFVTPTQKLAISNTADGLGISVSELMRRAVLNFNATSEQIKVAGIVDRLRAPKTPDARTELPAMRRLRRLSTTRVMSVLLATVRLFARGYNIKHETHSQDDGRDGAL